MKANAHNWTEALEIQAAQHKWQLTEVGRSFTESFFRSILRFQELDVIPGMDRDEVLEVAAPRFTDHVIEMLHRADTIFVTREMQHLIMQAAEDFPEPVFDFHTLITPMGFCVFEDTVYGEDRNGRIISIKALAWHVIDHAEVGIPVIPVYFFSATDDPYDDINKETIPETKELGIPIGPLALSHFYPGKIGEAIPQSEIRGTQLITELLKIFVTMQLIAQQPIAAPQRMTPDRAARRRLERMGHKDKQVTLITLRRKKGKPKDEGEPIHWTRRWIVRGHWRKQPYPSLGEGVWKWKYIFEYIKGPEDKPLVVTERRVFDFRR